MPAFRFLHTSDFHLERPPAGLAELPDHLRDILVEAPYRAAANVFDAAIEHEVAFVLLAGDIVAPERSGPRGILFLRDQLARLAERNIGVYWAGGFADRTTAQAKTIQWPANLYIFSADEPQRATVTQHGRALCEIVGQSLPAGGAIDFARFDAEFNDHEIGHVAIALAHGDLDEAGRRLERFAYWGLGGEHEPTLPQMTRPLVHHPGSPQGRSRDEPGPHGCTLVEVADNGDVTTMPILTDVVRFASERLSLSPVLNSATDGARVATELERLLRERMQALADANPDVTVIVEVSLEGDLPRFAGRWHLPLPTIAGVLRGEFGYRSVPVWLDRVRLPPPAPLCESWFGQETLVGDVLRAARRLQRSSEWIELDRYLPLGELRGPLCDIVNIHGQQTQAAVHEASSLAVGLLWPEEVRS